MRPEVFIKVLSWFQLNHGNLSVLIHPQTGDDVKDHTSSALWLGEKLPLLLNVLVNQMVRYLNLVLLVGKGFHLKTLTITKQPFKDAIVNVLTTANVS